jgi:hypothetical protein
VCFLLARLHCSSGGCMRGVPHSDFCRAYQRLPLQLNARMM